MNGKRVPLLCALTLRHAKSGRVPNGDRKHRLDVADACARFARGRQLHVSKRQPAEPRYAGLREIPIRSSASRPSSSYPKSDARCIGRPPRESPQSATVSRLRVRLPAVVVAAVKCGCSKLSPSSSSRPCPPVSVSSAAENAVERLLIADNARARHLSVGQRTAMSGAHSARTGASRRREHPSRCRAPRPPRLRRHAPGSSAAPARPTTGVARSCTCATTPIRKPTPRFHISRSCAAAVSGPVLKPAKCTCSGVETIRATTSCRDLNPRPPCRLVHARHARRPEASAADAGKHFVVHPHLLDRLRRAICHLDQRPRDEALVRIADGADVVVVLGEQLQRAGTGRDSCPGTRRRGRTGRRSASASARPGSSPGSARSASACRRSRPRSRRRACAGTARTPRRPSGRRRTRCARRTSPGVTSWFFAFEICACTPRGTKRFGSFSSSSRHCLTRRTWSAES